MISYSHRIFMYGPIALLVLLAAGYSLYWQASAQELAAELDAANGHEVIPGIAFAFAEKSIGGYPFRLDAVLSGVTFAHKGEAGETAWRAEKIALHSLSYGAGHYLFEAAGLQSFAWPDEAGATRVLYVTPGTARASAILQHGKLQRFDLDVVQAEAQDAAPAAASGRNANIGRAQFHLRARQDETVDVAIKIEGARIGPGFSPALGPDMPGVIVRGVLTHGETLKALRAGDESLAKACEAWRVAGGSFDVTGLSLKWGSAVADATATLAFDGEHRLMGAVNGFISGNPSVVTPAAESGPAHATLAAIAEKAADARGRLPVSIVLQNGAMMVGTTQVASFEPLY